MSDQFTMFGPMTSPDIRSVISSPESESGATPCDSPDGKTSAKSGLDRAPASRSQTPGKRKRSTTRGIFGQSGFLSSEHDDLSYALASRLRPLTDSLGSTLFTLTWTTRITPAGRSICALRASERRTEDSGCIGWPTPTKGDGDGGHMMPKGSTASGRRENGSKATVSLAGVAQFTGWASPKARDHKHESPSACSAERIAEHPPDLSKQVQLSTWPTPRAEDAESSGMRRSRGVADTMTAVSTLASWQTTTVEDAGRTGSIDDYRKFEDERQTSGARLRNQVYLAGWPTPMAGTPAQNGYNEAGNNDYTRKVVDLVRWPNLAEQWGIPQETITPLLLDSLQIAQERNWEAFGVVLISSTAEIVVVRSGGQLVPEHSRWLMGVRPDWDACAVTAMASLRKSRKRS